VVMINEWIARRWPVKSVGVPAIRLNDSCDTSKQKARQAPAIWHFHFPSFLKYSLRRYNIPQTTYPPGKRSNFLE